MTPGSIEHALALAARGHWVFPVRGKVPTCPHGFKDARSEPDEVTALWAAHGAAATGVGIATGPSGLVVLDVDVRDHLDGGDALADLESAHGPLPGTYEVLTPNGPGRHIYFRGSIRSLRAIAPGLDVRSDGGYVVGPGSQGEDGGLYQREVASPDEIAPCPTWLLELAGHSGDHTIGTVPATSAELLNMLEGWQLVAEQPNGDRYYRRPGKTRGSHSAVLHGPTETWPEGWLHVFSSSAPIAPGTYGTRALTGGEAFLAELEAYLAEQDNRSEPRNGGIPVLPPEFWASRPVLRHIHQAARSRRVAPDALLGAVLARVCLHADWRFVIPAVVGRAASLNSFVALCGRSGAGKGAAMGAAAELLASLTTAHDHRTVEAPVGSGEGLVRLFFAPVDEYEGSKKRTVMEQVADAALVNISEGEALTKLGQRSSQTTMTTLRQGWSGEAIGFSYAAAEKNLRLREHSYRMAVIMAIQPELARGLFEDSDGGTPQRFIWASLHDPDAPEDPPEWPGPLTITLPAWKDPEVQLSKSLVGGYQRVEIGLCEQVLEDTHRLRRAGLRGDNLDPLDSHSNLARIKIAALLSLMDSRIDVDPDDWHLAGQIMETSKAVRTWALRSVADDEDKRHRAADKRAINRALATEEAREQAHADRIERITGVLVRAVEKHGPMSANALRHSLRSTDRAHFAEALAAARDQGLIEEVAADSFASRSPLPTT